MHPHGWGHTDAAQIVVTDTAAPRVIAVSRSPQHTFSKASCEAITLLQGLGVEGDAHLGRTVKHRSRVKTDPDQPNLRQVHLIGYELLETLRQQGFRVGPGVMGENVTTAGVDLLGLPRGTRLRLGACAVVEITGLRNPCAQLDNFQDGLMNAVLERTASGGIVRKAGIMGVVVEGGRVSPRDPISVILPPTPHQKLERV